MAWLFVMEYFAYGLPIQWHAIDFSNHSEFRHVSWQQCQNDTNTLLQSLAGSEAWNEMFHQIFKQDPGLLM